LSEWFSQAINPFGIELLPIDEQIAARAVELSPFHQDPSDHLIIATALEYDAKLASVDNLFIGYPELDSCLLK
jgi:PIN domain nuclease of toxin-antitoxin system